MAGKIKEKCSEHVGSTWRKHPCGKPAKGSLKGGNPACGVHLRAEKQREASCAKWDAEWKANAEYHALVKEFCLLHAVVAAPQTPDSVVIAFELFQKLVEIAADVAAKGETV